MSKKYLYTLDFKASKDYLCYIFKFSKISSELNQALQELSQGNNFLKITQEGEQTIICFYVTKENDFTDVSKLISAFNHLNDRLNLPKNHHHLADTQGYEDQVLELTDFPSYSGRPNGCRIQTRTSSPILESLKKNGLTRAEQEEIVESMRVSLAFARGDEKIVSHIGSNHSARVCIDNEKAFILLGVPLGNACAFVMYNYQEEIGSASNCDNPAQQIILFSGVCTLWRILQNRN